MVKSACKFNVIVEDALFINVFHRERHDNKKATIHTHDDLFVPPLESFSLSIIVGFKFVSTWFVVIPESNMFNMKLGIPCLVLLDVIPSIVHKLLKFPHEGM